MRAKADVENNHVLWDVLPYVPKRLSMNYNLSLSGFIILGLTSCSANDNFSKKTFDAVNKVAKVEKLIPIHCTQQLEFENIAFKQKCWKWNLDEDISENGRVGVEIGWAISKAHNSELDTFKKSEFEAIARLKTKDNCANYVLSYFDFSNALPDLTPPLSIELSIAASENVHCKTLSKVYEFLDE